MAIISSQIVKDRNRGNGSRAIHEEHTDHNGKIHERRYYCPIVFDVNAELITNAAEIEAALIEREKEDTFNEMLQGKNPASVTPDLLTEAESVRARMRAFLTGQATEVVHMYDWANSFTTPQLNTLGFTSAERGQINARVGTIGGVKDLLDTDSLFILEGF